MMMIDDDLGMSSAAFPDMPGTTSAPGSGHNSCAVGGLLPLASAFEPYTYAFYDTKPTQSSAGADCVAFH